MNLSEKTNQILENLEIESSKSDRLYKFEECSQILLTENSSDWYHNNENQSESTTLFNVLLKAGHFLYSAECYDDALEYYQKCLQTRRGKVGNSIDILDSYLQQIEQLSKTNVELIEDLVILSNKIGGCMRKTNQANEGVEYLRLSAEFKKSYQMTQKQT